MKIWEFIIVLIFGYSCYCLGATWEQNAKGMKPSRKHDLSVKSLFTIVTFGRFYLCDECGQVHRRKPDDLDICGGPYAHKVFVSQKCADNVFLKAGKLLRNHAVAGFSVDSVSRFLDHRSKMAEPISEYDKTMMKEASKLLEEQQDVIRDLNDRLYKN